ncbi:MAG TPA: beta-ketoacyl-[acyl-carrier-protein] synthase family protein [Candidatus Polarisedimenticolaceae bacterium]|nr:beta-ketoacyl-[acyl-carrier-protein] synthase family protein [Candidatus Polarisedimenticolaceae bacterium]
MSRDARLRVVVTGVGVVSAWGWGADRFWRGVLSGKHALGRLTRFEPDEYATRIAGEVPLPAEAVPARPRLSFADRFALAAAREAVGHAGLDDGRSRVGTGVFFGSSTGGMYEGEAYYRSLKDRRGGRVRIAALASQQISAPAEAVARELGVCGPVETMSSACASSTLSIGAAVDAVRDGSVRVALAGGADSLCRTTYGGFNALRAVDERPCRPFRADRAGLSMGEGAAVLVLEREADAIERGAVPLAEAIGSGASADANHMTAPDSTGRVPAQAMDRALADAGVHPDEVDFINAHGTGTELNDLAEYRALEQVFGTRATEIPLTSTKGSVGHLLGSAGAIEAVATVLCLHHRQVHPTPGGGAIDPRTPVRLVTDSALSVHPLEVGLSLNLAFGGCNAALVFSRWQGE